MPNERLIELDLHAQGIQPSDAMKAFIDQVLVLLRDALGDSGAGTTRKPSLGIDELRTSLTTGQSTAAITSLGAHCLDACREAVAHLSAERAERQQEVRSLLELMREALASVAAGSDTLQADLAKSADRFQALAQIQDPDELKARLTSEVSALKHLAVDCRAAWQGTVGRLDERVTLLEAQLRTISTEASLDTLTGIANRRVFERTCRAWIGAASPQFVLAILDLDNFKPINDTFGHATGDQVLMSVARTLAASVRADDVVARLGGDEFVILASQMTLRVAESRLSKILSTFNIREHVRGEDPAVHVTVSCGIAEYSAGDTLESLLKRADEALYDAKRQGKHRVMSKSVPFLRDLLRRRG